MTKAKSLDDDYFVRNAIYCWLYYMSDKHEMVPIYKELLTRESFNVQSPPTKPRPARRRKPSQSSAP